MKKIAVLLFVSLLFISCKNADKENYSEFTLTEDGSGIVFYTIKWKHPTTVRNFHMTTGYGIRVETYLNFRGNYEPEKTKYILLDRENKVGYKINSIENLEKIIMSKIPENSTIYYYGFCTTYLPDRKEVMEQLNLIFKNANVNFIDGTTIDENQTTLFCTARGG
jgi:hypothetical protein